MRKITALLVACILSVGIISLAACTSEGDDGQENGKIPQIPAGVVLNDVKVTDALEVEAQLRENRNASNNVKQDEYVYLKETFYNQDDGSEGRVYEWETLNNVKYLKKDGKIYGEKSYNVSLNDKNRYIDEGNNKVNYEKKYKTDTKTFVKDGSIGTLRQWEYYENGSNGESEDILPLDIVSYSVNVVEALSHIPWYNNIAILTYSISNNQPATILPNAGEVVLMDTEYKLTHYEDNTKLFRIMDDIDSWYGYDMKVKNYKSSFKADWTKMYFECSYRLDFTDYNSQKIYYSLEYKYVTYLDTDAGLNVSDFKDKYITDEMMENIYYYDCDKKQVAADFMSGKEIVINPVGGADVSNMSFSYEEGNNYISAPYILFVNGENNASGYIAGIVADSHARVENGKVIINSDGAFDVAKQEVEAYYDSFDFENSEAFLVIKAGTNPYGGMRELYIPLK